jgi:hypothetical protein
MLKRREMRTRRRERRRKPLNKRESLRRIESELSTKERDNVRTSRRALRTWKLTRRRTKLRWIRLRKRCKALLSHKKNSWPLRRNKENSKKTTKRLSKHRRMVKQSSQNSRRKRMPTRLRKRSSSRLRRLLKKLSGSLTMTPRLRSLKMPLRNSPESKHSTMLLRLPRMLTNLVRLMPRKLLSKLHSKNKKVPTKKPMPSRRELPRPTRH